MEAFWILLFLGGTPIAAGLGVLYAERLGRNWERRHEKP